jgi:DNA-binding CsgD family transcriptional regulator
VTELPSGRLDIAIEIGRIASGPGPVQQRAEALLGPLRRLVPFQALGIYVLDRKRGTQVPIVSRGYDEAIYRYITSPANTEEIELLGFNRTRLPMRVGDLPVPREQVPGWAQYLRPAGFREGLAVGLFTPDGRHLGLLGMNTDTDRHPTREARDLIGMLAPTIANAVDPLRSITRVAGIIGDAKAGIVLTCAGNTLPLPGLPTHPLLEVGSDVAAVATELLTAGRSYSSFLCPYQPSDAPDSHLRITMLACPPDSLDGMMAVVLVSPSGDMRRLTRRELQILGLIIEGWPNHRIAAALVVTQRTVNAHLEHILAKLDAPTRTLAAVRALRFGLYVPRPLNGIMDEGSRRTAGNAFQQVGAARGRAGPVA